MRFLKKEDDFSKEKLLGLPLEVPEDKGFSTLTKLLIILVPLFAFAGYYQYSLVSGATFFGKTLSSNVGLESGLVGHWTFDGPNMTASTALDSSGSGNTGTLTNGPTKTIGKTAQGLNFDGTDDYVNIPSFVQPTSAMSVSLWIKAFATPAQYDSPAGNTDFTWSAGSWALYYDAGTLKFWIEHFSNNVATVAYSNVLEWHHVVGTWDGTTVRIWVDGVQGTPDSYSGTMTSRSALQIGATEGSASRSFPGKIDDVRIYNHALSAKEIERLYQMGEGTKINTNTIPTSSTLEDGLVGYWSFNGPDMTASTALDGSGFGHTGTLTNGPTKTIGKVGQGVSFDGTNDYISVSGTESVKSLSYWVKADSQTNGGIELNANQYVNDNSIPEGWTNPTIYIDGVAQTTSYGSDVVVNGDFSANITGWTIVEGLSTPSWQNAVSGDGSTGYHRFSINNNVNWDRYRHTTNIISANTAYRVSFWYRTSGITGNMRAYFTSDYATMANVLFSQNIVPSTSWQYVSIIMTSTSASYPIFGFMKYGSIGSGTFDVDAVSIEPVTNHYLITDTDWHHVAITTDTAITASAVKLGKGGWTYFDGVLDEVRMYNRALSAEEVAQLYNNGVVHVISLSPPDTPTGFSGSPGFCTGDVDLSWQASNGATSYEIAYQYSPAPLFIPQSVDWYDVGNVTSTSLSGLGSGTSYTAQVRAVNSDGVSTEASTAGSAAIECGG